MNRAIVRIRVKNLFGRYDYDIPIGEHGDPDVPRICFLYGDNGTGKTTILELVFHLLSTSERRGHKTYVSRTPFEEFDIFFSDDSRIRATRCPDNLIGSFKLEATVEGGKPESAFIETDPDSTPERPLVAAGSMRPHGQGLYERASELALDVFYLGDSRNLEGDSIPRHDSTRRRGQMFGLSYDDYRMFMPDHMRANANESNLVESIRRTEQTLNREVMRASSTGETDARQVYVNILNRIASPHSTSESQSEEGVSELKRELQRLAITSEDFARFGLGPAIDVGALSESLESADASTLPVVRTVLSSFLDGQRARLNALQAVYERVNRFVETTNEYFTDKSVEFDIYEGLTIRVPNGRLDPDSLSSGEKHLLLLFLNVIAPSLLPPLFIIDEPELSLNIKWQRSLVETLLKLSEGSKCQFLMATHSIELLTKHTEFVHRLAP